MFEGKYKPGEELWYAHYEKAVPCMVQEIESTFYHIKLNEPLTKDGPQLIIYYIPEDKLYRNKIDAEIRSVEIQIEYLESNKYNLLAMLERNFKILAKLKMQKQEELENEKKLTEENKQEKVESGELE